MFKYVHVYRDVYAESHWDTRNINKTLKDTQNTKLHFRISPFSNITSNTKRSEGHNVILPFMLLFIFHILYKYSLFGVPRRYHYSCMYSRWPAVISTI